MYGRLAEVCTCALGFILAITPPTHVGAQKLAGDGDPHNLPATATGPSDVEEVKEVKLFPFCEQGKWGYMNSAGTPVIKPQFDWAEDFYEGWAFVSSSETIGFIDAQGRLVFRCPPEFNGLRPRFSDGLVGFCVDGQWGYLDRQGKVAIDPLYDDVREFCDGVARVSSGVRKTVADGPVIAKWGFIDRAGRWIVQPERFEAILDFSEGLGAVIDNEDLSFGFVDKTGRLLFNVEYESDDPKRGVSSVWSFSEGLAWVETSAYSGPYVGFIDKSGRFVIPPRFGGACSFSEGLAAVRLGEKWCYVDRTGHVVIESPYCCSCGFREGLTVAWDGAGASGYMDKQGKVVIDPGNKAGLRPGPINSTDDFSGGLARVHIGGEFVRRLGGLANWKGGAWYYINRQGEIVRRVRRDDERGPGYGIEGR